MGRAVIALIVVVATAAASGVARAQAAAPAADTAAAAPAAPRIDVAAVQGLLAVQRLDGWLLYDYQGQNPIAAELVAPRGLQTRRWFYFVPARGQPVALVHKVEASNFERVPGRKIEYAGWRELDRGLAELLRGSRRIAMEHSPRGALPALSRVDAGALERVRAQGVEVVSSAELVQYTKSIWGEAGRASHHVAVHHLVALREDALAFVAQRVRAGKRVTEHDVQQRIARGYEVRGLVGEPPIVAVNAHAADPHYTPARDGSSAIQEGDLLLIDLWAKQADVPGAIYADMTWMAYVGADVPARFAKAFAAVAAARDQTVELITERVARRRPVRGFEADQRARNVIGQAGYGDQFVHRTGHSIDTDVHGAGANLDDFETHDERALVRGSGFSVEPGIYVKGDFGVRSEINVYIGGAGVEVTTPVQREIEAILNKP
jgi:Xaa-Pro aminopeptidase